MSPKSKKNPENNFIYKDETKIRRQLTLLKDDGPDRSDMSSRVQITLIY